MTDHHMTPEESAFRIWLRGVLVGKESVDAERFLDAVLIADRQRKESHD